MLRDDRKIYKEGVDHMDEKQLTVLEKSATTTTKQPKFTKDRKVLTDCDPSINKAALMSYLMS